MPRIILERHAHAPELTRARIVTRGGIVRGSLRAPGSASIKAARAALFAPMPARIVACVTVSYPPEWASLNRTYSGRVDSRRDALAFAQGMRERNKGGPLFDGRTLPPARVAVRTMIQGG